MNTLEELAQYLERQIIDSLEGQNHVASGKLRESIKVNVEKVLGGYVIVGNQLFYGKFVDSGVGPRKAWVPVDVLIQWMRDKNIPLRGAREEDVAKRIRWAIWNKGIPTSGDPSKLKFLRNVLNQNEQVIQTTISAYFKRVVALSIKNSIENATRFAA
jgi:hypothetical protein